MHRLPILSFVTLFLASSLSFAAQTNSGLYFNTFGDSKNPPILFLHGGPGYNSYTFEYGAANELANNGYYVVVFDQRGCGRSSAGIPTAYTFPEATKDIIEVIQTTGIKNPMLIGHSWGGTLAIEFLKLHAGVSRGAILLDAPVSWPGTLFSMTDNTIDAFHLSGDVANQTKAQNRLRRMFPDGYAPVQFYFG